MPARWPDGGTFTSEFGGQGIAHGDPGEVEGAETAVRLASAQAGPAASLDGASPPSPAPLPALTTATRVSRLISATVLGAVEDGDAVLELFAVGQDRIVGGGVGEARGSHDGDLIDRLEQVEADAVAASAGNRRSFADVDHVAAQPAVLEEPVHRMGKRRAGAGIGHILPDELHPVVDRHGFVDVGRGVGREPDKSGGAGSNTLDRPGAPGDLFNIDIRCKVSWHITPSFQLNGSKWITNGS